MLPEWEHALTPAWRRYNGEGLLRPATAVTARKMEQTDSRNARTFDRRMPTEGELLAALVRRSMFWTPERAAPSAWIEHVPFAFWLVDVLRPRTIVELGASTGVSYSAFCQAVKFLQLPTSCIAIDTWQGDEHVGRYSENVYREFESFHNQRYSAFSRLVKSTFDQAVRHFDDGSVDLLHIDGVHTYETVRHDYESWLPKLSADGVVLFHDANIRENGFGVFRLWSEIIDSHSHFSFLHGHGLGFLGSATDTLTSFGFYLMRAIPISLTARFATYFLRSVDPCGLLASRRRLMGRWPNSRHGLPASPKRLVNVTCKSKNS